MCSMVNAAANHNEWIQLTHATYPSPAGPFKQLESMISFVVNGTPLACWGYGPRPPSGCPKPGYYRTSYIDFSCTYDSLIYKLDTEMNSQ